ncbi:MAG: hypothetical protein V3T84_12460 [Phycisphaerales bacterium]
MSNTIACETLDVMCNVCGIHCATWVGEDEHGDRHYTLDACDDSGQRFIVHGYDLTEAVCALAELLGCDLSDDRASSESSFAPFFIFVVRFTHRVANQIDDMPIDNFLG